MVKKINHLGIAVKNIESALPYYRDVLGMQQEGMETVPGQKVRVAFLRIGESRVELLEPTSADSPVAKFLEKNGEGLHHVAYEVEHLEGALADLKKNGLRLIDETPRPGAHGTRIAFLHPKDTGGILTELCQAGKDH
jgi:methylmalonyl-CoA/ethylmalonyl-CoA epimerase